MSYVFEVNDKTGRKIRATKEQWKHLMKRHSYMEKYIEEIKETLKSFFFIVSDSLDKGYYYKSYKYLTSPNHFILVIAKYLNGEGFVITAYLEENIK